MKIACPSCSAAYDVPAERLVPGRGVRCARCGVVWTPVGTVDIEPEIAPLPEPGASALAAAGPVEGAPVAEAPVAETVSEAMPSEPAPMVPEEALLPEPVRQPVPRRTPVLVAWVVTAAILGVLGWLAVTRRAEIVRAWPPSERAYTLLRLPV